MKLRDLQRDAGIKIFTGLMTDGSKYVVFNHIDGMYSHCTTEKGGTAHLSASTPLREIEGGYEIDA